MEKEILIKMREAILSGNLKLVKELISTHEGLLDTMTVFGSWLHVASTYGQIGIVKYLIDKGLDINIIGGILKCQPIRSAAGEGHLEIVRYLYDNGAILDVSEPNRNPLFSAIYNNHFDVAKFLIDNGIDITVGYDIGSLKNADACEYARQFGRNEIRKYLLDKLGKN